TELWDLIAMCGWHHPRYHDGQFDIHRTLEGDLQFLDRNGKVFGTATGGHWKRPKRRAGP
ncbi:MAG: hypothetical protein ACREQ5_35720, partial [Candidatus Dormibacteria bacterium]